MVEKRLRTTDIKCDITWFVPEKNDLQWTTA